jgi:hypothetical protein
VEGLTATITDQEAGRGSLGRPSPDYVVRAESPYVADLNVSCIGSAWISKYLFTIYSQLARIPACDT